MFAVAPTCAISGRSARSTCCRCARWWRSQAPSATRFASSIACSASATARSPMAWMCSWKPAFASAGATACSTSGAKCVGPVTSVARPSASRYGAFIAAVRLSGTPSSMILTLVARRRPPAGPLPVADPLARRDEGGDHVVDVRDAEAALEPERTGHLHGQPSAVDRREVRVRRVLDAGVGADDGVLPAGHAEAGQVPLRLHQARDRLLVGRDREQVGEQLHRALLQGAGGAAVRIAVDVPVGRVREAPVDAGGPRAPRARPTRRGGPR